MTLLNDAEWAKWSNAEISRRCGVADTFVGDVRRHAENSLRFNRSDKPADRTFTTKHGTVTTMKTAWSAS